MTELNRLSNQDLVSNLKTLAQKERELLHEVLIVIKELDRRRLYLKLGYPNLFSYLTQSIGYSEGSAQRRIDAARLLNEIPEVGEQITSGEITLSHISIIQRANRELKKEHRPQLSPEAKKDLLLNLTKTSSHEAQSIVAQALDLKVEDRTKIKPQADESVRLELTLSKAQYEKFKQAQELLSHVVPDGDPAKLIEYFSEKVITQKTKLSGQKVTRNANQEATQDTAQENTQEIIQKTTATVAVKPKLKSLTSKLRKVMLQRDQCCQYKDPLTGKQCRSRWQLEMDHHQPRWANGSNNPENLRIFCKSHNAFKYQQEAGIKFQ